jgi:hypothetical protein
MCMLSVKHILMCALAQMLHTDTSVEGLELPRYKNDAPRVFAGGNIAAAIQAVRAGDLNCEHSIVCADTYLTCMHGCRYL